MFEFFTLTGQSLPSLFVAFTRGKAVGGISSKYLRYYFKSCQWVGNDGKSKTWLLPLFMLPTRAQHIIS